MSELSKMSDFELGREILLLAYPTDVYMGAPNKSFLLNWNDLMPLVLDHGISYSHVGYEGSTGEKVYMAGKYIAGERPSNTELNKNPQRALAECLYLVLKEQS